MNEQKIVIFFIINFRCILLGFNISHDEIVLILHKPGIIIVNEIFIICCFNDTFNIQKQKII